MTEIQKRCTFIDQAKAIAIILMVLLHTTPRYEMLSDIVGAFHMAVFFIIGGMFFKNNSFLVVLKKSVQQLIIPYFCFSIFALTICWISPKLHPELYQGLHTIPQILTAAFYGIFIAQDYFNGHAFMPLGPLWFLVALFWCRLLFYFWINKNNFFNTHSSCIRNLYLWTSIIL